MTEMVRDMVAGVVTVVLTAVGATWRERLRWRRSSAAQEQERALETKRALRLVERELFEAECRIARAVEESHFTPNNRVLTTVDWTEYRGVLSTELGAADWRLITAAYDAISDLNQRLQLRLGSSTPEESAGNALANAVVDSVMSRVREDDKMQLRWRAIRTASWILRAYLDEAEKVEYAWAEDERLASQLWPPQPQAAAASLPPSS
jgi:hypothetical protein